MSKARWIIFIVVTVGFLASLIAFSRGQQIDVSDIDVNKVQTANSQNGNIGDHVTGKIGSKVTLIEYADFQCPGCASISPRIMDIVDEYKDQLQFVFRAYPISSIHPNARAAAATVEAAGLQGKYWEMYEKVYAGQASWEHLGIKERAEFFVKYASDLKLDTEKFSTDVASKSVSDKINYDLALGRKAKVNGTPSFFLNGQKLDDEIWSNIPKLKKAIDAELEKADIKLPE